MKATFGHIADIHIGNYPGKVEKGGINSRFVDFVKTYNESIDKMIKDDVDFVVMPGDIFRNKTPTPDETDAFADGLIRLQEANIPTAIILGNHDTFLSDKKSSSISVVGKFFDFAKRKGAISENMFYLSSKPEIVTLKTKAGDIQIQSMPYPIRTVLRLETVKDVEDYVVKTIDEVYETRDKSKPIMFMGHFSIRDALVGGEQMNFDKFAEPVISKSVFEGKDYLYVAMGHLHKYQVFINKPLGAYCGSNNRVDFNEAKEDKGFIEVNIDGDRVKHRFVKVDARKFCDLKYDLTKEKDPQKVILKDINSKLDEIKNSIVRLTVTLSEEGKDGYNVEGVVDILEEHCYSIHGSCIPIVKKEKEDRDLSGFNEGMSMMDAVKHYAEVKKVRDEVSFMRISEEIIKKIGENNEL